MKLTWIVVADTSRARFFTNNKSNSIQEIEDMAHPQGREHEQNLTSDLPGKDTNKTGSGKHSFQDKTEPKQQEAIDFAKQIAKHLDEAFNANKFEQLMIVAAPSFLGTLRHQFSDEIRHTLCFELNKNITQHTVEDIRIHLPEHFPVV